MAMADVDILEVKLVFWGVSDGAQVKGTKDTREGGRG